MLIAAVDGLAFVPTWPTSSQTQKGRLSHDLNLFKELNQRRGKSMGVGSAWD